MSLRTLLIDNYDSYTYNLFQLIAEVNGGNAQQHLLLELPTPLLSLVSPNRVAANTSTPAAVAPDVIYNNQLTWDALSKCLSAAKYDNIVISPGPGTPDCPADIGRITDIQVSQRIHTP